MLGKNNETFSLVAPRKSRSQFEHLLNILP